MKFMEELSAPTRIRVKEGDTFAYRIAGVYRLLRVIHKQTPYTSLLYFYSAVSDSPDRVPTLSKDDLQIRPMRAFNMELQLGQVVRVSKGPVLPADRFEQHCFRSVSARRKLPFVDEYGNEYAERFEPYLSSAYWSLYSAERFVATALGLVAGEEEHSALQDLPTPLLDGYLKSLPPSSSIALRLLDIEDIIEHNKERLKFPKSSLFHDASDERRWSYFLFRNLWRYAPGIGDVARQLECSGFVNDYGEFVQVLTLKRSSSTNFIT
jgi:hypothetical protein